MYALKYSLQTLSAKTLLQYFDCLPLKINVLCRHSTRKMISASRRIFFGFTSNKLIQYFDCLPLKINTFMSSFNKKNDQCVKAHLFWFDPPFLSIVWPKRPLRVDLRPNFINCLAKTAHFYNLSDILYQVNQVFEKGFGNLL